MAKTTIQINISTLERLKTLRAFERQSYDDALNNLMDSIEEEPLTEQEIKEIQQGLEEIKRGKYRSIESIAKELGIALH
jgi:phage-related protein